MKSLVHSVIVLVALVAGFATEADALVLDWSSLTWTPGSLSNSYDIDPSSPGDDVTITISGTTGELATDPLSGLASPDISTAQHGGQSSAVPGLNLAVDLGKQDRVITITVTFSAQYLRGVEGLIFTIFGIDRPGPAGNDYIDQIRSISGNSTTGAAMAPTISNLGSSVTLSGTGVNQVLTGNNAVPRTGAGSGNGNATISFGAGLRSFSFSFGDDNPAFNNPVPQDISLSNLSFAPVPEINPAFAAATVCTASLLLRWRRRSRSMRTGNG